MMAIVINILRHSSILHSIVFCVCVRVQLQLMNNGQLVMKDRCLLLFSNMILCAAMRWRKKKGQRAKKVELESTTGSR